MDDTRNIDRTILRIVTVAGAASRAASAAIGHTTRDGRRPEDFDITVDTAQHLTLRVAFSCAQFLVMLLLLFRIFCVHIHWPV